MSQSQLNPNYRQFKKVSKLQNDINKQIENKAWVKYQQLVTSEIIQSDQLDGTEHTQLISLPSEFDELESFVVSTICVTPYHSVSSNVVFDRVVTQFETASDFGNRLRVKYKSKTDLDYEYVQLMFIISKFTD